MDTLETEETDYRTISQEYAQGAIKASLLINGGAAVAVLSQFAQLSVLAGTKAVAAALLFFYVFGVAAAAATWVFAFYSTRHVDRKLRGQDSTYEKADSFMFGGFISICVSLGFFIFAAFLLVCSIQ